MSENAVNIENVTGGNISETSLERFMRDVQIKEISIEIEKSAVERYLQGKLSIGQLRLSNDGEVDRIRNDIEKTVLQSDKDLSRGLFFPNPLVGNTNMPIRSLWFLVVNGGAITTASEIKSIYEYNRNTDVKKVSNNYPDIFGTNITIRSNYRKDTNEFIYALPTARVLLCNMLSGNNPRENNEKIENLLLTCKLAISEYEKYYIMNIKRKDAMERKQIMM